MGRSVLSVFGKKYWLRIVPVLIILLPAMLWLRSVSLARQDANPVRQAETGMEVLPLPSSIPSLTQGSVRAETRFFPVLPETEEEPTLDNLVVLDRVIVIPRVFRRHSNSTPSPG